MRAMVIPCSDPPPGIILLVELEATTFAAQYVPLSKLLLAIQAALHEIPMRVWCVLTAHENGRIKAGRGKLASGELLPRILQEARP